MPIGDPRNDVFYPTLKLMMDSYILAYTKYERRGRLRQENRPLVALGRLKDN